MLPVEQLGAIKWLAAKHLAVVDWRLEPAMPPTDRNTTLASSSLAPLAAPTPRPRTELLGMVNSVFHIHEVCLHSSTHIDFHTEGGRTIEIKHGDATLVDPQGGVRRSLCIANVSCASFSVDAAAAEGLHEAALRALLAGGFEIDDDIRALPLVQRLLTGPLVTEVAAAAAPHGMTGQRRLQSMLPLCTNTCGRSSDGICDDGLLAAEGAPSRAMVFFCALGTDCDDCTPGGERSNSYDHVRGNEIITLRNFLEISIRETGNSDETALVCLAHSDGSSRVPSSSRFHSYYTNCSVSLDANPSSSGGTGSATFTLNPSWAGYTQAEDGQLDWLPTSVWMTYERRPDAMREGFDGGTIVERFCSTGAGDFQGRCRIRYTYADNRGLLSRNAYGHGPVGIWGRMTFDLIWHCSGTTGVGVCRRRCDRWLQFTSALPFSSCAACLPWCHPPSPSRSRLGWLCHLRCVPSSPRPLHMVAYPVRPPSRRGSHLHHL